MRAVRAAAEMQEELVGLNARFQEVYGIRIENRTGVNTGEVVAGDVSVGHRLVTGDTVNVAARLEQNAPTMEILLGEPTYRLVKDGVEAEPVEPLELKGKSERMPAYRLLSVGRHQEGVARRLDAPMVGRDDELAVLTDALDRARAIRELPGGDRGRPRRDGEVTPPQGVRRPFRGSRPARAMPLLRRGSDVLAARGDREERCRDRQRRPGGGRDGQAGGAPRAGGTRRRGSDRGRDRPVHRELSRGGDVLGRPALLRAAVRRTAADRADRRYPLGGADVPRPHLLRRDEPDGRARGARVLGPARPLRRASRVGRGVGRATGPRAPAPVRGRERGGGREPARHHGPRCRGAREDRRGVRGQPALRGADALDAPGRRDPREGRPRAMDPDPRGRRDHDPSDDPGAALRAARPPRSDRPGGGGAGVRDRPGLLPGRRRGPLAGRGAPPYGREPPEPHAPRARGAARIELRGTGGLPVHAHPDPRGRLPRAAEADAGRPPRPLHRLAGTRGLRSRARVRGDPRLSPRAGVLHAPAARTERRAGLADRRTRERLPLLGRAPGAGARRHPGGREPPAAGRDPAPAGPRRSAHASAWTRRRP